MKTKTSNLAGNRNFLYCLLAPVVRFFGLKGSWKWAVKEMKKAFQEAVEDYIATCKELGKEPEKTYKGSFNVRIPSELHRQAAQHAILHKMTLNDFVSHAIDAAIVKEQMV